MDQDAVIDVYHRLGGIEGKLDSLITAMAGHVTKHTEIETRVRALENFKAKIIGIVMAVSAVVGGIWSAILAALDFFHKS